MHDFQVEVGGLHFQVRQYEHNGETILFLHYGNGNLEMWNWAAEFFKDDYQLLMVDLRGHGLSDHPEGDYHLETVAQDVRGILETLKMKRVHVVGSSFGAEIGLVLAAKWPEMVISLVCDGALFSEFGSYGAFTGTEAEFAAFVAETMTRFASRPKQEFESPEALMAQAEKEYREAGWWNPTTEAMVRHDIRKNEDGRFELGWLKWLEWYMEEYYHCRFEDYYRRVTCPVLMITSEDADNEIKRRAMEGLLALTPAGRLVILPDWIHPYSWFIQPEAACKAVLGFLLEGSS